VRRPPERVEIPEEEDLNRERFARILAILIVVATLGVACVEYLHSVADKNADAAGVEAQKLSVERQGELVRADDKARAELDVYAFSSQERTQQGNAFQEYLNPAVKQGSAEGNLLQLEETRWSTLADLTGELTSVKSSGATSPAQDLAFPNVLLAQASRTADRLFALEDAQNQLRGDWQSRVGLLSVVLTLLAVAIYLFGLSLALHAAVRRWLVGLGVVLMAGAGVWTLALLFTIPSGSDEKAADAYSEGMFALNTFYTHAGDEGLKQADADFTKAIQLRPRFASAYLERSQVRFLLGSPQRTENLLSITTGDALRRQGDDLGAAYGLGLKDYRLLNNLAANKLLDGIATGQQADFGSALTYLGSALDLAPDEPLLYYNQGLAYLGQGRTSQAQNAYGLAVRHTQYTDVAHKKPRNDPNVEQSYVGSALTTLDLLGSHRSDLASTVKGMKQLVISGVDRNQKPPSGQARASDVGVTVFPGELEWTATLDNFDESSDTVATEWYYRDPRKLGWSVLSPISGVAVASGNGAVVYNSVTHVLGEAEDHYFLINSYLRNTNQCLQPGTYRTEVYVNGRLVAQAQVEGGLTPLTAQTLSELAVAFCHPNGWTQDQTNFLRGFSNGYVSPDKSEGLFVFRFQNPGTLASGGADAEASNFRDLLLGLLQRDNVIPSINKDSVVERTSPYFLGFNAPTEAYYDYSDATGSIRIGAGVADDGAVLGAVVFAPNSQWKASTPGGDSPADFLWDSMVPTG
jgi:tetratricopeptide (TPR) repeat protein